MQCSMLCLCPVQIVQPDPRVTRLVEELSSSLKREAELPEGDQIPAILVMNKVRTTVVSCVHSAAELSCASYNVDAVRVLQTCTVRSTARSESRVLQ